MPPDSQPRFAGVLARHAGRIVLVREEYAAWGGAYWNIPSGRIEDHESPAEGASRELAEETGLVVRPGDLVLQSTSAVTSGVRGADTVSRAWNFSVAVHDPTLRVDDPDELIQEARWFSTEEAMRLLRELPYRPLSEPALAILEGQVEPGVHWAYSDPRSRPSVTRQE
ncbi:MAG TPA: NUDIX hydrolase [Nocardioides sp.]|nr:NUDIX hydrolase [Nocardioides sp.]